MVWRRWFGCEWWLINIVKCVECCDLLVREHVRSFISVLFLSFTKQHHLSPHFSIQSNERREKIYSIQKFPLIFLPHFHANSRNFISNIERNDSTKRWKISITQTR